MSEILREAAQWRKGKTPIIAKYLEDHAKLMAETAGKGFLSLPGYVGDVESMIELLAKSGISELNYKIMAETVERELKQQGINYNLAYKAAAILWEIDKQGLMSAWESEYAGIKKEMALEEEIKARLAIDVVQRAIYLLEQKTVIELEMEAYRTQLAQIDGATAPYEIELANAKVLTAQKKLTIIPILEMIIEKELELLILEQSKSTYYSDYMMAEQEVALKQLELLPVMQTILTKEQELLNEESGKSAFYSDLLDEEQNIATKKKAIIPIMNNIVAEERNLIATEQRKSAAYAYLVDLESQIAIEKQGIITVLQEIIANEQDLIISGQEKATAYEDLIEIVTEISIKRQELIPILERIISKQTSLLFIEEQKQEAMTALVNAEVGIAHKKELLIGPYSELVNVTRIYATKIADQMNTEGLIADEKVKQAASYETKAATRLEQLTEEVNNSSSEIDLTNAKRDVARKRQDNDLLIDAKEIKNESDYQKAVILNDQGIIDDERDGKTEITTKKTEAKDKEIDIKELHSKNVVRNEGSVNAAIAAAEALHIANMEKEDEKNILAKLIHLIGQ